MNSWVWLRGVWNAGRLWAAGGSESNWNHPDRWHNAWWVHTNFWSRDNPAFEIHRLNRSFGPRRIG